MDRVRSFRCFKARLLGERVYKHLVKLPVRNVYRKTGLPPDTLISPTSPVRECNPSQVLEEDVSNIAQVHCESELFEFKVIEVHTRQLMQWLHANAGVVKAIVSFYRIDSESAFERFRSRIPITDVNTVHVLKKHLVAFLGLKELARKFGFW